MVRPTGFRMPAIEETDQRAEFQQLYAALVADEARNRLIIEDASPVV